MARTVPLTVVLLSFLVTMGCGPATPDSESASSGEPSQAGVSSNASPSSDAGIKSYAPSDLSVAAGQYMPPLEGGALDIAPPQGWDFERAGNENLVGFVPHGSTVNNLPRILVSAEDCPYPEFSNVNAENIRQFTEKLAGSLADKALAGEAQPLLLGDNAFARYVAFARQGNATVANQHLVTSQNGRMYTVRLESYQAQFQAQRDAGYAVGASMKFGTAEAAPVIPELSPATADGQGSQEPSAPGEADN